MLRGVFRAESLVHIGDHGLEQFPINIALAHDIAACNHAAVGGYDASVGIDDFRKPLDCADAATQPRSVDVVQYWLLFPGNNSAGDQHVQPGKVDKKIAVSVRCRKVAVIDALSGKHDGIVTSRGLVWPRGLG